MRLVVIAAVAALVLFSGCKICGLGACAKDQGRAVAAVVPQPDGTIVVTTCSLVTKGSGATLGNCNQHTLPRP